MTERVHSDWGRRDETVAVRRMDVVRLGRRRSLVRGIEREHKEKPLDMVADPQEVEHGLHVAVVPRSKGPHGHVDPLLPAGLVLEQYRRSTQGNLFLLLLSHGLAALALTSRPQDAPCGVRERGQISHPLK